MYNRLKKSTVIAITLSMLGLSTHNAGSVSTGRTSDIVRVGLADNHIHLSVAYQDKQDPRQWGRTKTSTVTHDWGNLPFEENGLDRMATHSIGEGVFNSKTIPFSGIATEADWKRVKNARFGQKHLTCEAGIHCRSSSNAIHRMLEVTKAKKFFEKMQIVNAGVNRLITYKSDRELYRSGDYWATPLETVRAGAGDCEDFATLKMAMLASLGVPTKSMSLVVLKDGRRDLYHAVLAVSTNKGTFILDNVHNRVLQDKQLAHYQPLYSFSNDRSWLHGRSISGDRQVARSSQLDLKKIQPGEGLVDNAFVPRYSPAFDVSGLKPAF